VSAGAIGIALGSFVIGIGLTVIVTIIDVNLTPACNGCTFQPQGVVDPIGAFLLAGLFGWIGSAVILSTIFKDV
jgi:hypothetical protein